MLRLHLLIRLAASHWHRARFGQTERPSGGDSLSRTAVSFIPSPTAFAPLFCVQMAADLYLRCGDIRHYCEIMAQLGKVRCFRAFRMRLIRHGRFCRRSGSAQSQWRQPFPFPTGSRCPGGEPLGWGRGGQPGRKSL